MTTTTKNLTMYVSNIIVNLTSTIEATVDQCIRITINDVSKEEFEAINKVITNEELTWEEEAAYASLTCKQRPVIAKRLNLDPDQIQGWEDHKEWRN